MTKAKFHVVPCTGEAHSNPHIDNCMVCAPLWAEVVIPVECATLEEWRNLSVEARASHKSARTRFTNRLVAARHEAQWKRIK